MKKNSKKLRTLVALAIVAVVAVGFVTNVGIGTMSAPGIWDISILCPLGALGTMLASKMMVPRAVISLIVMVLLIVLFARAFCGWICPVPLVQKLRGLFAKKQPVERGDDADPAAAPLTKVEIDALGVSCSKGSKNGSGCASCASKRGAALDARHFVLGGALASTFIFGFPVFCLVCPIGLTFATILLVINLFSHGDVTWSLIVVPALLIAEVLLFKKWCHKLCPLSAFMSLIAKANKTFVPTIDDAKCLETAKGGACGAASARRASTRATRSFRRRHGASAPSAAPAWTHALRTRSPCRCCRGERRLPQNLSPCQRTPRRSTRRMRAPFRKAPPARPGSQLQRSGRASGIGPSPTPGKRRLGKGFGGRAAFCPGATSPLPLPAKRGMPLPAFI